MEYYWKVYFLLLLILIIGSLFKQESLIVIFRQLIRALVQMYKLETSNRK